LLPESLIENKFSKKIFSRELAMFKENQLISPFEE
jgi:hypothetical protein